MSELVILGQVWDPEVLRDILECFDAVGIVANVRKLSELDPAQLGPNIRDLRECDVIMVAQKDFREAGNIVARICNVSPDKGSEAN